MTILKTLSALLCLMRWDLISCPAVSQGEIYRVTAYCPCEICCRRSADGITASGKPAEGFLVAAPPEIPFGTLFSIPGYAEGFPVEVKDRGGAIKGKRLDVFFNDHDEALRWGVRDLKAIRL